MKAVRVHWADLYRDGGSYGFGFDADDGRRYEFFLKTTAFGPPSAQSHEPPVLNLQDCNDGDEILRMSWDEAQAFVAPLVFDNPRFEELVAIVMRRGEKTP